MRPAACLNVTISLVVFPALENAFAEDINTYYDPLGTSLFVLIGTCPGAVGGFLLGGLLVMLGSYLGKKAKSENGESIGSLVGGCLGAVIGGIIAVILFTYVFTALLTP